ncbi:MAG: hypothetical protein IKY63_05055, partial [Tidjanibacter sp.]|nr:hypothetical protein [Tidjanibacter sp.]
YTISGATIGLFDLIGLGITVVIMCLWLSQWLIDRKRLSLMDPLREFNPEEVQQQMVAQEKRKIRRA